MPQSIARLVLRRAMFFTVSLAALALTAPHAHAQDPLLLTRNRALGAPVSPYDARVSPYSPVGARNPYATDGGRIYGADGTYLGTLNANRYDPESVANPYGRYGSRYSSTSVNNPYSKYGSRYSNSSARNPYASAPPVVLYPSASPARSTSITRPSWQRVAPERPMR